MFLIGDIDRIHAQFLSNQLLGDRQFIVVKGERLAAGLHACRMSEDRLAIGFYVFALSCKKGTEPHVACNGKYRVAADSAISDDICFGLLLWCRHS